jgi:hypothetical protein
MHQPIYHYIAQGPNHQTDDESHDKRDYEDGYDQGFVADW